MEECDQLSSENFGYDYFDNPEADGYRGYHRDRNGDYPALAWSDCARFCREAGLASALDLGCAKGYLVEALLDAGISAVGYDVSHYALSFAKRLPCHYHDIREPIPDTADAVFALGVLQYFNEDELAGVLMNIGCATRHILLFSTYYAGQPQEVPDTLRRVTQSLAWWRETLTSAGFTFCSREKYFDIYRKRAGAGVF
jgi:SAM-dependent methyltransferase